MTTALESNEAAHSNRMKMIYHQIDRSVKAGLFSCEFDQHILTPKSIKELADKHYYIKAKYDRYRNLKIEVSWNSI